MNLLYIIQLSHQCKLYSAVMSTCTNQAWLKTALPVKHYTTAIFLLGFVLNSLPGPSVQSLISKCFLVGVKVVCGFLWGSLEPFHANQWGPAPEELHAWLLWTRLGKWANRLHGSRFSRFSWPLKYGRYSPYLNASQVIFDRSHWPLNRFLIRSHSVGCQCYKSDLCRLS